jgi:cysteine synthase
LRDELLGWPTPLLRFRGALLKLESLRPSGESDDRALSVLPALPWGASASLAATAGAAIAAAAWAQSRGVRLFLAIHGIATYEARETLRLFGAQFEVLGSVAEATARASARGGTILPPLDGDEAPAAIERTLGPELAADAGKVRAIFAPAGARAALVAALRALPGACGIALVAEAEDEELPGLPRETNLPAYVERRAVSRASCAQARAELAREAGLLVSHASAMAALLAAAEGGLALVSTGEREFSLEGAA